jgi:NADH-quinone oxidoreductase subunit L
MPEWFDASPGRLYVVAALLPLVGCALLLLGGLLRSLCRPRRESGGAAGSLYWLLGGDRPLTTGAYLATGLMACTALLAVVGLTTFLKDAKAGLPAEQMAARWSGRIDWIRVGNTDPGTPAEWDKSDSAKLVRAESPDAPRPPQGGRALELGYRIDHLTALMVAMVAVIGTLIFVFSLGYMRDETKETVEDHEVDHQTARPPAPPGSGHDDHNTTPAPGPDPDAHHAHGYRRRGRYGRFFAYLSLFAFSMLNLLIADNLFQVFVSWELVGVCSFFLIGFYYERPSASIAANNAYIVNRVGDAGFLVGIVIAWTYLGTLNIE